MEQTAYSGPNARYHCTALAVIVTKTLAGKISETKQDRNGKLTTPHVLV